VASEPILASPNADSASPNPAHTIIRTRRRLSGFMVVLPPVFMGVILFVGPEMNAEPVTGGGLLSICVRSLASVVASVCLKAAMAGAPPFVSTFQAKRDSARQVVQRSSSPCLYARSQSTTQ